MLYIKQIPRKVLNFINMKKIYLACKQSGIPGGLPFVCLFIFVFDSSVFSQEMFVKTELTPSVRVNQFQSGDDGVEQSSSQKLYTLFGNDFEGPTDFYLTFNLKNRQVVRYEVIDIKGRSIGLGEIPDVLDQTYKVDVEAQSSGMYIV
ncbi:MAG: hypothetical protein C0490_05095, partial [Marivirga sp.]|nr:hypothetical protein [Marivirga sp.]